MFSSACLCVFFLAAKGTFRRGVFSAVMWVKVIPAKVFLSCVALRFETSLASIGIYLVGTTFDVDQVSLLVGRGRLPSSLRHFQRFLFTWCGSLKLHIVQPAVRTPAVRLAGGD